MEALRVSIADMRKAIRKGLDSGPAGPLDMEVVKAEARKRLSKNK